jgi:prolyl oligopeptidase
VHTRALHTLLTVCALTAAACTTPTPDPAPKESAAMSYPETRRDDVVETLHGVEVADPYRWLEDVDGEGVRDWMKAQNALTRSHLEGLPGRDALRARFSELFKVESMGAPIRKGERFFLYRRSPEQEKFVVYWKDGEDGEEKVLIDPNTLSEDGSVSLGGIYPTQDGALVAYRLKENNADESTMYVMDVAAGTTSEVDVIPGANYTSASWLPDNSGFYYTVLPTDPDIPEDTRPGEATVRFHALGTPPADDPIVVPATKDPQVFQGVGLSRDGSMLFLYTTYGWNRNELSWRPAADAGAAWSPIATGLDAKTYVVEVLDGFVYLMTNHEAPNWKLLRAPAADPTLANAEVIVAERPDGVLDDASIVGGKLVLTYMERARNVMKVHALDGAFERDVTLPGIGSVSGMIGQPDHAKGYFTFTSYTTPRQIYEAEMSTGETRLWAQVDVPVDPSAFQVDQVEYASKDGTTVTMFLVHKKDIPMDGSTPFLLYGYGGFNVSMTPYFSSSIYPWLEAGGGYAVANLRGGGEYGEAWHKDGMLDKKQNVFDDFIAAAEYLVSKKYTSPEHLGISGGSNGGLLVGAAMTQRPDLFGAVVCSVPLLDMVRYHLSGRGRTWISEYGSAEDPDQFATLHAYSPYHRVRPGPASPPPRVQSAASDDRVDPLHARKMAAALQAADPDGEPILLHIEENAGHGGGDMVSKAIDSSVDTYSFLMKYLGLPPK